MVNSEQISVQLYIDNLEILHKDQALLDDFLD